MRSDANLISAILQFCNDIGEAMTKFGDDVGLS